MAGTDYELKELLDKLVAENPDIPSYQQELAATLQNFGVLLQLTKRPEASYTIVVT